MNPTHMAGRAQDILATVYRLNGTAQALPGERDLNFLVGVDGKARFVLKIMHPGCPPQLVEMQCALLKRLDNNPAVRAPRVQPTHSGEDGLSVEWFNQTRWVWLISVVPGTLMAQIAPLDSRELTALGQSIGHLSLALAEFDHPALARELPWNLTAAASHRSSVGAVDEDIRAPVEQVLREFSERWAALLARRPVQAVHNDLNDHNILMTATGATRDVAGLIDFGDAARQPVVCELAIACAYAAMDQSDEVSACCAVIEGFCTLRSLEDDDVALLYALIKTRLAVSLCVSSRRRAAGDKDPYAAVSHAAAKSLLRRLCQRESGVVDVRLRQAAGLCGVPAGAAVRRFLQTAEIHPVMAAKNAPVLDLGVGSQLLGADPAEGRLERLSYHIAAFMQQHDARFALGRYMEPRLLYQSAGFGAGEHVCDERRTVHLGIDVFAAPGAAVTAPLPSVVHRVTRIDLPLDYGPLVLLRHVTDDQTEFFTLYGHLEAGSVMALEEGQKLAAGEVFCRVGAPPDNGGWPPHLHLQLIVDDLGLCEDFPGVCAPAFAAACQELCPNPAILLGCADARVDATVDEAALLARRAQRVGPSLSLSYDDPLHIVRGFGPFLYDSQARGYLDFYNNVAHVGHSHPHVVGAVQRQVGLLNTNTRYLHHQMLDYAERLTAKMPAALTVCVFVNSASEANELALRMARAATGRRDMVVAAHAYHGHTSALIDMSPYKYNGSGGAGPGDWVHEVPVADDYRGPYKRGEADLGPRYAAHVERLLDELSTAHACAGFIAETLPSVGGQIVLPDGYLRAVYRAVRAHGGLCIADEVQTGFGRLGEVFWGFEHQEVVPDIVVLGKPIANGFPMGAIVTTRAIAEAFDNGMEFFATFGGNPVACAAASAVLEVVESEALMQNARRVGGHFLERLRELKKRHALIGDVRGKGFFIGVELVHDHETLEPAADAASFVVNQLRHQGVLCGTDGPLHNVIKMRPTMVTTNTDVERAIESLDRAFDRAARRYPKA